MKLKGDVDEVVEYRYLEFRGEGWFVDINM